MIENVLKVQSTDNIIVALRDLERGSNVEYDGQTYLLKEDIPIKHKFAGQDFEVNDRVLMYGVTVGKALKRIPIGSRITVDNVGHSTDGYAIEGRRIEWIAPDVSVYKGRTFMGYHRSNGQVGTRNYWIVIPLVFCENRNIKTLEEVMLKKLGYVSDHDYVLNMDRLIDMYQSGASEEDLIDQDIIQSGPDVHHNRVFPNVDGIKFLTHEGGCGGIRQDSEILCRLLAGYICHPNVAGATVLSLGCQNAQVSLLRDTLHDMAPDYDKPLYILEQQDSKSEREFVATAVKQTFIGLMEANKYSRQQAPLSQLTLGLECGGSDGFSGITANPALGYTSDMLVALGGKAILSEFPELNGVEQELINRCSTEEAAHKFASIMRAYSERAESDGSGFYMNPSPGNIKDGLITDAMKSAGAAKKGGTSSIVDVLDYAELAKQPGLNLLCTPGNDVESTTGLAGSGANLIVFTTGLGTPTGNAIAPTVKMSSNSNLAIRMGDIIDINAGTIIGEGDTIESKGVELLEFLIKVASGEIQTHAERLSQDDFIPWKRGISL